MEKPKLCAMPVYVSHLGIQIELSCVLRDQLVVIWANLSRLFVIGAAHMSLQVYVFQARYVLRGVEGSM